MTRPKPRTKIKGAYAGPIAKKIDFADNELILDRKIIERIGREFVSSIVREARKDFAKRRKSPKGQPVPDGGGIGPARGTLSAPNFFRSFGYRIRGKRTIEVYSTWPWIDSLLEGRPRAPMTNLTAEKNPKLWRPSTSGAGRVRKTVPIMDKATRTLLFRVVPLQTENAWIHPGIQKHTFMNRGMRNARKRLPKLIAEWLKEG